MSNLEKANNAAMWIMLLLVVASIAAVVVCGWIVYAVVMSAASLIGAIP